MTRVKLSLKNIRDGGTKIKRLGKRVLRDMEIHERIAEMGYDDSLLADGFDSAIIGVSSGFDSGRVIYDIEKMICICVSKDGMSEEDATEHIYYNVIGSYVGEKTPIYMDIL